MKFINCIIVRIYKSSTILTDLHRKKNWVISESVWTVCNFPKTCQFATYKKKQRKYVICLARFEFYNICAKFHSAVSDKRWFTESWLSSLYFKYKRHTLIEISLLIFIHKVKGEVSGDISNLIVFVLDQYRIHFGFVEDLNRIE